MSTGHQVWLCKACLSSRCTGSVDSLENQTFWAGCGALLWPVSCVNSQAAHSVSKEALNLGRVSVYGDSRFHSDFDPAARYVHHL